MLCESNAKMNCKYALLLMLYNVSALLCWPLISSLATCIHISISEITFSSSSHFHSICATLLDSEGKANAIHENGTPVSCKPRGKLQP